MSGGRASEELYAGSITTGAADDLAKATRLATAFVAKLGFDKEIRCLPFKAFA